MLKLKTTAKELLSKDNLTDLQIKHQSLPISKHSLILDAVNFTKELRMSLQPDSHASRLVLQESKPEQTTHATCGLKQSNVLGEYDHDTHSWKTCQGSLLLDISEPSLQTFTKHGTMQNGALSELTMLVHHTEERDCGYWLTPSTVQISGGEDRVQKRTEYRKSVGRKYAPGSLAEQTMWPTPRAGNPGSRPNMKGRKILAEEVKKYPTPATRDYKGSRTTEGCLNIGRNPETNSLGDAIGEGNVKGQLNPDWVEWLMGWLIGWSSLEPMEGVLWLDWSIDPADDNYEGNYPTASACQRGAHVGREMNGLQTKSMTTGTSFGMTQETFAKPNPGTQGRIPRIATGIKDRVNRLKAIGNGQVSIVAATAYKLLSGDINKS